MNSKSLFEPTKEKPKPVLKTFPFPWGMWTRSNIPMPGPTRLSSIGSRTFTQTCHKLPLVTMGCPTAMRKITLAIRESQSELCDSSSDPADPPPKRHPDPISRFSQCIGQTDQPTNGPVDKTCTNTQVWSINDIDMANNNYHSSSS